MDKILEPIYEDLRQVCSELGDIVHVVDYLSLCDFGTMTELQYDGLIRVLNSNLTKLYDDFGDKLEPLYHCVNDKLEQEAIA